MPDGSDTMPREKELRNTFVYSKPKFLQGMADESLRDRKVLPFRVNLAISSVKQVIGTQCDSYIVIS